MASNIIVQFQHIPLHSVIYSVLAFVISLCFMYFASIAIYRLYFSPLSHIPGPKFEAISILPEFYWDCVKQGQFTFRIQEYHKKYGPIVRIRPDEVHIDDPTFYDYLYTNNIKYDKPFYYYRMIGTHQMGVAPSAELHRVLRGAASKFFSNRSVMRFEPELLTHVSHLCDRLREYRDTGKPLRVADAFHAFAYDVVTAFALTQSANSLNSPNFPSGWHQHLKAFLKTLPWNRFFPWLFPAIMAIPPSWIERMDPSGVQTQLFRQFSEIQQICEDVIKSTDASPGEPVLLGSIYQSMSLQEGEKPARRLFDEAQGLLGAGTETVAETMARGMYYILFDQDILHKLKSELATAARTAGKQPNADFLDNKILDKLPYLHAVVKESARIASLLPGRLPRSNPNAATVYTSPDGKSYVLPPGTSMSMSIYDLHMNPTIFPDPHIFRPERWIESDPQAKLQMERAWAPFGRGSRSCIGIDLAKLEMLLMMGNLFWKFDYELFKTTQRDVSFAHDLFTSNPPMDSVGVRVLVV